MTNEKVMKQLGYTLNAVNGMASTLMGGAVLGLASLSHSSGGVAVASLMLSGGVVVSGYYFHKAQVIE